MGFEYKIFFEILAIERRLINTLWMKKKLLTLSKFSETIIIRNLTPTVKGGEDGQSNNQKPNPEPFWT